MVPLLVLLDKYNFMTLTIKSKQEIFKGKFLKVWSTIFLDKEGKERIWEWVEKKDAAIVLPITKDNKIVLIKNFRVPLEKYVIEAPAGLLDNQNENNEEAVRRELLEETGYTAEKFIALPPSPYAAGTSNNLSYFFIATGATKIADIQGDITEDISVLEIPANELVNYYLNNPKQLFNTRILALYQIALAKGLIEKN